MARPPSLEKLQEQAVTQILDRRNSIDVEKHSRLSREEMLDSFSPQKSVGIRVKTILEYL